MAIALVLPYLPLRKMPAVTTGTLLVFLLITVALVLFVTEAIPADVTAIGVLVALALLQPWTGVTAREAIQSRIDELEEATESEPADTDHEEEYAAEGVLSILPSTTMAAWSTVYTGAPAAEHGVPGNEWFDREAAAYRAPASWAPGR